MRLSARRQRSYPDRTEDDARKPIIAELAERVVILGAGEGPLKEVECEAERLVLQHPVGGPSSPVRLRMTAHLCLISRTNQLKAGITDLGYSLSRPSITFSVPLTTSVKRS